MATTSTLLSARHSRTNSLPLARIALVLLALLLAWNAYRIADEYYRLFALPFQHHVRDLGGSDFPAFYGGARLFLEDPSHAYDPDAQGREIAVVKSRPAENVSDWERYYNPPVYSLLLAPLTLFDLHTAYLLSFLLNAAGTALLLGVVYLILRRRPLMFAFFAAGLLSCQPLNYAFWHGQPHALPDGFSRLCLSPAKTGDRRCPPGLPGPALILKPHWLVLPLLGRQRIERRTAVAAALGVCLLALPFLIVGPQGTLDYVRLLLGRGSGDVADESFAEAVLSWSGFFRGLTGDAQVGAGLVMVALTLLYYAAVRLRGDAAHLPLAAAATFLLVVPHSHPQDWIILVPGAAILLRSQTRPLEIGVTVLLLLGVALGLENWSGLRDRRDVIYWPTLFGFGLLVWLCVLAMLPKADKQPDASHPAASLGTP